MLDSTILDTALSLKKASDAAYTVFKRKPTADSAATWTAAYHAYTEFCVNTITDLIDGKDASNKQEEILANIEDYRTCKQCGSEILYQTDEEHFIESSDFVPDFPGWCYTCLVEHCVTTVCDNCSVHADPVNCPFKETKNIYMQKD